MGSMPIKTNQSQQQPQNKITKYEVNNRKSIKDLLNTKTIVNSPDLVSSNSLATNKNIKLKRIITSSKTHV